MSAGVVIDVVSGRGRVGCKGPGAPAWLEKHGITVPDAPNRYAIDSSGVLSARLATSEFLIEATNDGAASVVEPVRRALEYADFPQGVYPVLRQDFVLEISGAEAAGLFNQTCAVDLEPVARQSTAADGPVIMTSMIGVSVVLVCQQLSEGRRFSVWSDPSYSAYFHSQLLAIVTDRGTSP
ncbi:MAG: hypothetical protein ABI885_04135 [Gammaproteobacteria bacterium]